MRIMYTTNVLPQSLYSALVCNVDMTPVEQFLFDTHGLAPMIDVPKVVKGSTYADYARRYVAQFNELYSFTLLKATNY